MNIWCNRWIEGIIVWWVFFIRWNRTSPLFSSSSLFTHYINFMFTCAISLLLFMGSITEQRWISWRWSIKLSVSCKRRFHFPCEVRCIHSSISNERTFDFLNCRKRDVILKVIKVPKIEQKVITSFCCSNFVIVLSTNVLYRHLGNLHSDFRIWGWQWHGFLVVLDMVNWVIGNILP